MTEQDPFQDYIVKMPIYQKAQQILHLVEAIAAFIDSSNSLQKDTIQHMMEHAALIPERIAGAELIDLYDVKMQSAALIRQSAMDLIIFRHSLELAGFLHKEYLDLVTEEIEELRALFISWINSFDPQDYMIDRWGLFNPPGIFPDDEDPDLDLPMGHLDSDLD